MLTSFRIIMLCGVLLSVIGLSWTSSSKVLSLDTCTHSNTSFIDGETLTYRAYYNWKMVWIPAGEVTFHVKETENEYQYRAIGKTYPSYDNFFKVNDFYATTVDKKTLLPKTFVRHIEEGKYRKYDSLSFDQKTSTVTSFNGRTRSSASQKDFPVDSCALDLLSVLYALRNTPVDQYHPGDYLDIEMFFDEEIFPIKVIYDKKEKKKIKNIGKLPTIKITPQLIVGNIFKEGDVMNVWVSDDKNKVPLLIESPISVGSVKAVLIDYKGLRDVSIIDGVKK